MDKIFNFDDFYEEYRKNNFYNKFNNSINKYTIILFIIMLFFNTSLILLDYPTIIIIIIMILSLIFIEVILRALLLSKIYNQRLIISLLKNKYNDINKLRQQKQMRIDKMNSIDLVLKKFNIYDVNSMYFIHRICKDKLDEKNKKNKTFLDICASITTVTNIVSLVIGEKYDELKLFLFICIFLGYYTVIGILYFIKTTLNKYEIEIYENILYDLELQIFNYRS